jgi:hypothetical protein
MKVPHISRVGQSAGRAAPGPAGREPRLRVPVFAGYASFNLVWLVVDPYDEVECVVAMERAGFGIGVAFFHIMKQARSGAGGRASGGDGDRQRPALPRLPGGRSRPQRVPLRRVPRAEYAADLAHALGAVPSPRGRRGAPCSASRAPSRSGTTAGWASACTSAARSWRTTVARSGATASPAPEPPSSSSFLAQGRCSCSPRREQAVCSSRSPVPPHGDPDVERRARCVDARRLRLLPRSAALPTGLCAGTSHAGSLDGRTS